MAVDWGSFPDCLAGVAGTVVAGGLFWEVRQRRLADEWAEADRRDAEAANACLVTVNSKIASKRVLATVTNDGAGPIRQLRFFVIVLDATGRRILEPTRTVPPTGFVGARDEVALEFLYDGPVPLPNLNTMDIRLDFTDAAGLRWSLADDLELRRSHDAAEAGRNSSSSRPPWWGWVAVAGGGIGAVFGLAALIVR